MGIYKYVQKLWKKPKENLGDIWKNRLVQWRKEGATVRLEHPTRIDRARSLGYRAKQGFVMVRQKVSGGSHVRLKDQHRKRRPKHSSKRMNLNKNYQTIAEERASEKYPNCEVLNSYWVASDGVYHWYEIILIDKSHPVIKADPKINWICDVSGRANRGLTVSSRRSRGLLISGKGAEKVRPSKRANWNRRA